MGQTRSDHIDKLEQKIREKIQNILARESAEDRLNQPTDQIDDVDDSVEDETSDEVTISPIEIDERFEGDWDWGDIEYDENYLEEVSGYDLHRLSSPNSIGKFCVSDHLEDFKPPPWISAFNKITPGAFIVPEPPTLSPDRLTFVFARLRTSLLSISRIIEPKRMERMFTDSPKRFLGLLERFCLYEDKEDEVLLSIKEFLGTENLKLILEKHLDRFPEKQHQYLQLLGDIPLLPVQARQEFLQHFQTAVASDLIENKSEKLESFIRQIKTTSRTMAQFEEYLLGLGDDGKKVIEFFGKDFMLDLFSKKYGKDLDQAQPAGWVLDSIQDLVHIGSPIWEWVLFDLIGVEKFKSADSKDHLQIHEKLRELYRVPHAHNIASILGEQKIRQLLKDDPESTLVMSAVGHIFELRNVDLEKKEIVAKISPGIFELYGLAITSNLFWTLLERVKAGFIDPNETRGRQWFQNLEQILRVIKTVRDRGFYPRPELILPLLSEAQETRPYLEECKNIEKRFEDWESVAWDEFIGTKELVDMKIALAFGSARKRVGKSLQYNLFRSLIRSGLEKYKSGSVVPDLPGFVEPVRLEVQEGFYKRSGSIDVESLTRLYLEIPTDESSILRHLASTMDLAKHAGYRLPDDAKKSLSDGFSQKQYSKILYEAVRILYRFLLTRFNGALLERSVKMILGHVVLVNPDMRVRLSDNDGSQTVEAFYELIMDRVPDLKDSVFKGIRDEIAAWLKSKSVFEVRNFLNKLESVNSLSDIGRVLKEELSESEPMPEVNLAIHQILKIFPLTNEAFKRHQNKVSLERSKLHPTTTGNKIVVNIKPSRSILNVFSGVYGEDCSTGPRYVARLFHPQHVFLQILREGSELIFGYFSLLIVQRANEVALKFDVINPSNNMNIDAREFLQKTVDYVASLGLKAGARFVGFSDEWERISNRGSIVQAARELYQDCPVEPGFTLNPAVDCFQSISSNLRVVKQLQGPVVH